MLTGPQRKFCERVVAGDSCTEAYGEAYRTTNAAAAAANGSRLIKTDKVKVEIAALRAVSDTLSPALLTRAEKRSKLAGILRDSSGIVDNCQVRLADKLLAIKLDNDLAGDAHSDGVNITIVMGGDAEG